MKNIQIIDGACNCTYDIFAVSDEEFDQIFPNGQDIEFAEDFFERLGEDAATAVITPVWARPVAKVDVAGIHGTLFYQLLKKKRYYPTKKSSEFVPLGIDQ